MRRYAIVGEQNAPDPAGSGQADATIVGVESATTVRPHLHFISFGCSGTPADQAYTIQLARFTDTGTTTPVTPVALDPGDPSPLSVGHSDSTVAPTYTASSELMSVDVNQRATFTWMEDPDRGIIAPATGSNGLGLYFHLSSGGSALCHATFHIAE